MDQDTLQYESARDSGRTLSARVIAIIATKIIGVYCLLQVVPILPYIFYLQSGAGMSRTQTIAYAIAPFAIYLVIGILLFIYGDRVAHFLLPRELQRGDDQPARPGEFQSVAFGVVGVVFIARSLPQLLAVLLSRGGLTALLPGRASGLHFDVIETIAELVVGLILFFRGNGISALLDRVRSAGVRR